MRSATIKGALLGLGSTVYAASAVNKQCQGNLCYSMHIPDATASSGSGDVFYQLSGPTSFSWIGMGAGTGMTGSSMLVVYTSSNGQNITLSPRKGSGHSMPQFDSSAQAVLIEGSGVSNGMMVANIKCSTCSASQAQMIYAARQGNPLNSDSQSASIQQHSDTYGQFNFDTAQAKGGSDPNPFVTSSSGSSSSSANGSGSSCRNNNGGGSANNSGSSSASGGSTGTPTSSGSSFPFGPPTGSFSFPSAFARLGKRQSNNDDDCGSSFSNSGGSMSQKLNMKRMAHGIMAGLAFAVLFPLGAISIRVLSFPGLVWFHAGIQIFTQIIFIIAFGLGVSLANELGEISTYHPVIGIVVFAMCLIQPVLGQMHHRKFKELGRRTAWSHGHLWLGRIIITLGIINGGLGFLLAQNTNIGPIAYAVVAAVFFIAYVVAAIFGEVKKARSSPPKYQETPRQGMSGPPSPREFYGSHNVQPDHRR